MSHHFINPLGQCLANMSGRVSARTGDWRRCSYCGGEFKPIRRSARFCGSTCRVAAHRATNCNAKSAAHTPSEAPLALQNESKVHAGRSGGKKRLSATRPLSVTRHGPFAIVADTTWHDMYRIRQPDGSLSDMVNLTRVRDVLAEAIS